MVDHAGAPRSRSPPVSSVLRSAGPQAPVAYGSVSLRPPGIPRCVARPWAFSGAEAGVCVSDTAPPTPPHIVLADPKCSGRRTLRDVRTPAAFVWLPARPVPDRRGALGEQGTVSRGRRRAGASTSAAGGGPVSSRASREVGQLRVVVFLARPGGTVVTTRTARRHCSGRRLVAPPRRYRRTGAGLR